MRTVIYIVTKTKLFSYCQIYKIYKMTKTASFSVSNL